MRADMVDFTKELNGEAPIVAVVLISYKYWKHSQKLIIARRNYLYSTTEFFHLVQKKYSTSTVTCMYRLWQRYDFHHTGLVNYKDFLARLGVSVQNRSRPPQEGTQGGKWSCTTYCHRITELTSVKLWLSSTLYRFHWQFLYSVVQRRVEGATSGNRTDDFSKCHRNVQFVNGFCTHIWQALEQPTCGMALYVCLSVHGDLICLHFLYLSSMLKCTYRSNSNVVCFRC